MGDIVETPPPTQRSRLLDRHAEICKKARDLMSRKNHDYTNAQSADGGVFANFKHLENFGVGKTEVGMFARFTDKVARLGTLITRPTQVADEKLEDTILDIINYAVLQIVYQEMKAAGGL